MNDKEVKYVVFFFIILLIWQKRSRQKEGNFKTKEMVTLFAPVYIFDNVISVSITQISLLVWLWPSICNFNEIKWGV